MRPPTVKSKTLERGKEYCLRERIVETMGTNDVETSSPTINLRITAFSSQGGRTYMEDQVGMSYVPCPDDLQRASYFYAGVYDGHGGEEAAKYAKDHLLSHITQQKEFWLNEDDKTLEAIKLGFLSLQRKMMQLQQDEVWGRTPKGHKSTSGSTASICIIRDGKLYIGHVGDSRVVVGHQKPGAGLHSPWMSEQLTKDHKPEDPEEEVRIIIAGGRVAAAHGVHRVVWKREIDPITEDSPKEMEEIPFLAVARSLGDFWSYNPEKDQFIVSPEPDVRMLKLNANDHRCVILASDGIWGMMDSRESVLYVQKAEMLRAKYIKEVGGHYVPQSCHNPSQLLGREALKRWSGRKARADNISVVTIVLEDPREPNLSYIPVIGGPIDHAVDSDKNMALENEDLPSSDVSSSDGDSGHMDSDLTTEDILAITAKSELQEQDVTSSSNEVPKMRKKAPRTPSPDITAPFWSLERRHTSAFQRYRRITPSSGQGFSPTVMKIGENGGTVSTPQRKRQTQNKKGTTPVRRRIVNSFSDVVSSFSGVVDNIVRNRKVGKVSEKLLQSRKSRHTPKNSGVHAQKKRRIKSMPVPALKKRKSPRRSSTPIVKVESPVSLDREFTNANPFCRVTRSQMKIK